MSTELTMEEGKAEPGEDSRENLGAIQSVFWVVPLYALGVGLLAGYLLSVNYDFLWSAVTKVRNPAAYKFLAVGGGLFVVGLAGVAIRSIECALILRSDPFRAFAMGRYILVLYLLVSFPLYLFTEWPAGKVEAPLEAIVNHDATTVVLDVSKVTAFRPDLGWWLVFLAEAACEFFSTFSLVAFCFVTYGVLARGKRPYDFDNFAHDITFGWKGQRYVAG